MIMPPQTVDDLAVQRFLPEFAIAELAGAVYPPRSWLDVQALRAKP